MNISLRSPVHIAGFWRHAIGIAACIATASCAHGQLTQAPVGIAAESVKAEQTTYTIFDAEGFPQPARRAFQPGPDGTSLPSKTPDAAKYWPPEFKQFLDSAIPFFKRGGVEPALGELEQVLRVRLIPLARPGHPVDAGPAFRLKGLLFGPPGTIEQGHYFSILEKYRDPGRSWHLSIQLDSQKYCVSPYEVAIYLGEEFYESDSRLHTAELEFWPWSYTWGMFKRGSQGEHNSRTLWLYTPRQEFKRPHRDPGCIERIFFFGNFIKESK